MSNNVRVCDNSGFSLPNLVILMGLANWAVGCTDCTHGGKFPTVQPYSKSKVCPFMVCLNFEALFNFFRMPSCANLCNFVLINGSQI